ncbi:MAG: hypothetical protein HY813_01775 [Candidatus Portnoybacteria bacterium]|nr:hypothetical protein [Candidatus Portnoybacteria bacterium]
MRIFNKKFLIILVILLITAGFTIWFYWYRQVNQQVQETQQTTNSQIEETQSQQSTTTIYVSVFKTHRNEEWGFEFQYPQNLIIKENTFGSYYSKFNLEIFTKVGERFDPTFLVNIVLPEFTERSFRGLEKTVSGITVAGVRGIKYQYKYQGFLHTVVILPFGELRMILATGDGSKQYLDEFNQILASFKFLK